MEHLHETKARPETRRGPIAAILVITMFALVWRMHYVIEAHVFHPVRGDAIDYAAYAQNLAQYGVFSKSPDAGIPPSPDSFRDPGYPAFLAIMLKLSNSWDACYAAILLIQACLSALSVAFALLLLRDVLRLPWLIAAGLLMALWPHLVTTAGYLLPETQTGFLCVGGLLLLRLGLGRKSAIVMALAGISLALAALTNAVLLLFVPLLVAWFAWHHAASRHLLLAFALAWLLLPGGWAIRNSLLPSSQTSTSRAAMNLVQGSWPEYHDAYRKVVIKSDSSGAAILDAVENEVAALQSGPRDWWHLAANRFRDEPWTMLAWYLHKPIDLWGWGIDMGQGDIYVYPTADSPFNTETPYRVSVAVCYGLNPIVMLLSALAVLACLVRGKAVDAPMLAAAFLLAYFTLVYAVFQSEPRYSIALRPLQLGFAILAAQELCQFIAKRRAKALRPGDGRSTKSGAQNAN